MTQKGEQLLKLFEFKKEQIKDFEQNYKGPEWSRRIQRLLKYRLKYLKYLTRKFLNSTAVEIKTFWGRNFWSHNDLNAGLFGVLGGPQELRLTKFLIKSLPEDSVFYDIGAHLGFYSILVDDLLDNKEIHAFEPAPNTFKYLEKNLPDFKNIFLNQTALSNKEGSKEFFIFKNFGLSVGNRFDISLCPSLNFSNFEEIKVKTITLDKYCFYHSLPTFLKVDVEGSEGYVIEGGIKTLKEANPIIAIEILRQPLDNRSHLKAIEILYNLGYKSYKINEDGELIFIPKLIPEKIIHEKDNLDNFIFLKK